MTPPKRIVMPSPHYFDNAAPFKIKGVYCRLIPLTRGQFTIVNDSDYESLVRFKWFALWDPKGNVFYAARNVWIEGKSKLELMHRRILDLTFGDGKLGDHGDHNTMNNSRPNLRVATAIQNSANSLISRRNSTGLKGVSLVKKTGKYHSQISINRTKKHLGDHDTPEQAQAAYVEEALKQFGEFAHNGARFI